MQVAAEAGLEEVAGAETVADALGGVVGQVNGVVNPPGTIVEVDVVVRVRGIDPEGGFYSRCLLHEVCWLAHPVRPVTKKPGTPSESRQLCFERESAWIQFYTAHPGSAFAQ